MPKKQGTIKPQKIVKNACNAKAKLESKLAVTHIKPDYNVERKTSRISLGSYMYVKNKVVLLATGCAFIHTSLSGFQ